MNSITESLEYNPIIAAVPHENLFEDAIASPVEVVFLLSGSILMLQDQVNLLKNQKKKVFVHIDLIDGLGKDLTAIDYIYQKVHPDGILSTRSHLLKYGKEQGLITIQRLFLIDSLSFESGIRMVKNYEPDFIEIMPGIIPRAISELKEKINQPIIAGGMITHKEDIIAALKAGALAVSTSKSALWE